MAFTSCIDNVVSIIDPISSVSRSNGDIHACKFKLIAFLGNYSMYCIRPDPLRASVRVWLRETKFFVGCRHVRSMTFDSLKHACVYASATV